MTNTIINNINENMKKESSVRADALRNHVRGIGNVSLRAVTNITLNAADENTVEPLTATFEVENVSLVLTKQVDSLIKESGYNEIIHPILFVKFEEKDEDTSVSVVGYLENVGFFNKEISVDLEQKMLLKKLLIEQIAEVGTILKTCSN